MFSHPMTLFNNNVHFHSILKYFLALETRLDVIFFNIFICLVILYLALSSRCHSMLRFPKLFILGSHAACIIGLMLTEEITGMFISLCSEHHSL